MMPSASERVQQRLLRGMPRARTMCRLVGNRFRRCQASLHKTRQGVKFRAFVRLHQRRTLESI